jgi:aspartyl-tRNA(Asn)/glutamyl-tRNA(Gln) amidotransferase subunit A
MELIKVKGWPLTMASQLTDKTPQTEDATTVSRLREAGTVIFASNSSPEYGFKGVTDSPLNGITRNPWNTERTPGGSSGGAGAAVAAGIGPLSIGTDGGGSVRIPAACTGLVGLKATYGRIPAWPASMHGDLANTGPMTRTTRDAALMLNVLKGADVRDPLALPPTDVDFVAGLDRSLKGLKVGLVLKFGDFHLDPEVEAAILKAADRFRALGCEVVPITPPTENGETGRIFVAHWFAALQRLLNGAHVHALPVHVQQAVPRRRAGNHSPHAFMPAGKIPGSPTPSRNRKPARLSGPRARPVSAAATDHQTTHAAAPIFTPMRSISQPDTEYITAYESRNAETQLA